MRLLLAALMAATPAFAQTTNDQATEQGRQTNTEYVSDATLTTKVHTALANDVGMRTMYSINVDSDKGVVTLKGKVNSQSQRAMVEKVVAATPNVTQVVNEIEVKNQKATSSSS